MRKLIFSVLLAAIILLGNEEIQAQKSLPKEDYCQPSAEEILSVIKSTYNLSPTSEGVVIAGEIQTLHIREAKEPLTLTQVIASAGGVLKTASDLVYLIRLSNEDESKSKQEIKLSDIKRGLIKDVILERGDVVFMPRGCVDGKLLPPTKSPRVITTLTDSPIKKLPF